eukprot:scpid21588/ scgid11586/ Retrovirus-related Pol polyprotein from transposon 412; Protease; Reverse transcriptase; Endonuclease
MPVLLVFSYVLFLSVAVVSLVRFTDIRIGTHVSDWVTTVVNTLQLMLSPLRATVVPAVSKSVHDPFRIPVCVENVSVHALVDTGSSVTLMSERFWSSFPDRPVLSDAPLQTIVSVDGTPVTVLGKTTVRLQFEHATVQYSVLVARIQHDVLLGIDFFRHHRCIIDPVQSTVHFPDPLESTPTASTSAAPAADRTPQTIPVCHVSLAKSVTIPALSHAILPGRTQSTIPPGDTYFMESNASLAERYDMLCTDVAISAPTEPTPVPCRVFNYSQDPITLPSGSRLGKLLPCTVVDHTPPAPLPCAASNSPPEPEQSQPNHPFKLDHLPSPERSSITDLLVDFQDCVSTGPFDMGKTDVITHSVHTGDCPPIRMAPRRLPIHQSEEVHQHIQGLLEHEVIEPSHSPWSAPIVVVRKPDGSIRLCVDYRRLNNATTKDAFPMPRVDDAINTMKGARYFTTLDLASGYWQVQLDGDAQEKSAFTTPFGLYQWKCMPFGLCNAPATFQRLMNNVLRDHLQKCCLVYLDDIIIFSRTLKEHLVHLRAVLDCLRSAHLKVKPSKCSIAQSSVRYLGHVFTHAGVHPDVSKIDAVAKWQPPTTITEVRQFLGFVAYYRRFIRDFSVIATPLYALTRKHSSFSWPSDAERAFHHLRQQLISAPILAYPDPTQPFILDTDASDTAIGAVLSQVSTDDGQEHPVAYGSKTLSSSQRNYTTTKRELLAIVEFAGHFKHYLLGQKFILRTDHKPLVWLSSFKTPEGIVARWIEKLSPFHYEIKHRPGTQHANADGLSRVNVGTCESSSSAAVPARDPCAASPAAESACGVLLSSGAVVQDSPRPAEVVWLPSHTPGSIQQAQLNDADISPVHAWITDKNLPARGAQPLMLASQLTLRLYEQRQRLTIRDGVLYRTRPSQDPAMPDSHQLVVPQDMRKSILTELHNAPGADHLGVTRTLDKARSRFYWPGMSTDIELWIKSCTVCQTRKQPNPKPKAPLQTQLSSLPFQRIALDIMGPLPITDRNNRYVLVIADYFTKWVEVYAMPNMLATTVARFLFDGWICRYGAPCTIHSDQGPQFESRIFTQLCALYSITKTRTTPYHPQSDGMVERFNRTLQAMIASTTTNHRDWDLHLQHATLAYRTSLHSSTGFTPYRLLFGQEATLPLDIMYDCPRPAPNNSYPVFVQTHRVSVLSAYERARRCGLVSHRRQRKGYDGTSRPPPKFEVDQQVLLFSPVVPPDHAAKLHHYWTGPYTVQRLIDDVTVRVRRNSDRVCQVVHIDRLKPFFQIHQPPPATPPTY